MSRSETVWIVDDDRSIRWVLEKALQQEGMTTQSFDSADGVMGRLARQQPDVIISDYHLCDGKTGIEAIRQLRSALSAPAASAARASTTSATDAATPSSANSTWALARVAWPQSGTSIAAVNQRSSRVAGFGVGDEVAPERDRGADRGRVGGLPGPGAQAERADPGHGESCG